MSQRIYLATVEDEEGLISPERLPLGSEPKATATLEEHVTPLISVGSPSAFTATPIFVAPFPCRITGMGLVLSGASVPLASSWWEVSFCKRGRQPYGSAYKAMVLADGPLHYWQLMEESGGKALDSAGSLEGTHEAAGTGTFQHCWPGGYLTDGEVGTRYLGSGSGWTNFGESNFGWANNLTMEAWVYPSVAANGAGSVITRQTIFGTENATEQPQLEIGEPFESTYPSIEVIAPGVIYAQTGHKFAPLRPNMPNHIMYTRNGSAANHAVYINGLLIPLGINLATAYTDKLCKRTIGRRASASQSLSAIVNHAAVYQKALTVEKAEDRYGIIARKNTSESDQNREPITQNVPWMFNRRISPVNSLLNTNEMVTVEVQPIGSSVPPALTGASVFLKYEAI
jgi:hypothetical protein